MIGMTMMMMVSVFLFSVSVSAWQPSVVFDKSEVVNASALKMEVEEMFDFGWSMYVAHAMNHDELKPVSCGFSDNFKGLSVTLIDALSTHAVLGRRDDFTRGVDYVLERFPSFDLDVNVSVFEVNIRVLGGLLSAHFLASNATLGLYTGAYAGGLLPLCVDLGNRLLTAFQTPTGLPYGTVNLRHGVPPRETPITCAACCSTFSLEFGALTYLTGDPIYYETAKTATRFLYSQRGPRGLVGTHIDCHSGSWVSKTSGLGGDSDSYYEMLYKSSQVFRDEEMSEWFTESVKNIKQRLRIEVDDVIHYVDSSMDFDTPVLTVRSLAAFWPGIEAMMGELESANKSIAGFMKIVEVFGFLPEAVCLTRVGAHGSRVASELSARGLQYHPGQAQDGHPLRPELYESIYHLHRVTKDPSLVRVALMLLQALRTTRVKCGFAAVTGVVRLSHYSLDVMDSFFLAEVLKYLWLLFADASGDQHWLFDGSWVFNTEAHLFPARMMIDIRAMPRVEL